VHGHDLDGVALALDAHLVAFFGRRDDQPRHQRRQPAREIADAGARASRFGGQDLEQVLSPEQIAFLMGRTGLSREELLAGLSQELPKAVDTLTPDGRVPDENEMKRLA